MLRHSHHNPKLFIDGKEVKTFISGTFQDGGGNQLQKLTATFSDPDLEDMALMNKRVELYLNQGSLDGIPIFRGYINQFTPTDKDIKIIALDPRMFLTGKGSIPIVIDEKSNFDGQTIVQFLVDYIDNTVNSNGVILSTEYLHEMDKPIYMTGIRDKLEAYSEVKKLIESKLDDETEVDRTNINSIFNYKFDIIHGGEYSGITIRKRRSLNENADFHYTYADGINSLTYNERAPPSYAIAQSEEGEQVIFEYGNAPKGNRGLTGVKSIGNSRGEIKENLISQVILKQQYTKEIQLSCTKGYTLGVGNIISIDVPKLNLNGNFEITSKNINISVNNIKCTFKCNNEPIQVSDYIN